MVVCVWVAARRIFLRFPSDFSLTPLERRRFARAQVRSLVRLRLRASCVYAHYTDSLECRGKKRARGSNGRS